MGAGAWPLHQELACLYGSGLVAFEIAEWVWIGLQPLEVVFGLVAVAIAVLALISASARSRSR